jgi:hypothetical protein
MGSGETKEPAMSQTALTIRTYLWARDTPWSAEQTHALLDDLAAFYIARGFANEDDESSPVRCIIAAGNQEVPDDARAFMAGLDPATTVVVIPRADAA